MIRMVQSQDSGHAKAYFSEALVKSDYYLSNEDQEISGRLQGKLAERLGLDGPVTKDAFFALCDNLNPTTGKPLTPINREDRTVGYDINFHCPKSVSILHALSNDTHIQEAFELAVQKTMQDIEKDALTRVRKNGAQMNRETGELLFADFTHMTSRPVEGHLPDPHLHQHVFVFNATYDAEEQQIKAVQFRNIKRDMPYYQTRFHKRLSDNLIDQGYQIRRTKNAFEVEGVPQPVIDLFSKRTDEIGRVASEKGITNPDEKGALGARTRAKKEKGLSMAELKANWRQQIRALAPGKQGDGNFVIRHAMTKDKSGPTPEQCLDHAIQHGFERASVLQDRRLLPSAYRHSIGRKTAGLDEIDKRFSDDKRLIRVTETDPKQGETKLMCTTKAVLAEEQAMVKLAQQGLGQLKPLYKTNPELAVDGQQAAAIEHVLTTTNRVSIIRGAAGTGKTMLMKEAITLMEKAGKTVTVVAPTAEASRGVLRAEGFRQAQTVAQLLSDKDGQHVLKGNVLWVDEAGLLGTTDMKALLELANRQNTRLILGGDTRQHASVVRGDALRILNTVAGVRTAEVDKIYRQRDAYYRSAVEDLANANVASGFAKLDDMGAIQTVDPLKPNDALVQDYIETLRQGKTALVISPTHQQSEEVTDRIREELKTRGILGKKEIKAPRLMNKNLTEAERSDWRSVTPGSVVQFKQNLPGIKRGSLWDVEKSSAKGVFLRNSEGETIPLPLDKASHYDLFDKRQIALAKGDHIRITRNGFDEQQNRLNNGQMLEVVKVKKFGAMHVRSLNGKTNYTLNQHFGHIAHAYCITSHASQGKTVDEVFIAQPASTFPGSDAKQFYVSVSRGRDRARIYTDDKDTLLNYAKRLGDRKSAIELVGNSGLATERVEQRIREELSRSQIVKNKLKALVKPARTKDRDYEPGI